MHHFILYCHIDLKNFGKHSLIFILVIIFFSIIRCMCRAGSHPTLSTNRPHTQMRSCWPDEESSRFLSLSFGAYMFSMFFYYYLKALTVLLTSLSSSFCKLYSIHFNFFKEGERKRGSDLS